MDPEKAGKSKPMKHRGGLTAVALRFISQRVCAAADEWTRVLGQTDPPETRM